MATSVLGTAPVFYTDTNGRQISIPLSDLQFNGTAIITTSWPSYSSLQPADQTQLTAWLNQLAQSGVLTPDPTPAPVVDAVVLTAKDPGLAGNNIQVTFTDVVPDKVTPGNTKASITVSETETYAGLTPDTLAAVLGAGGLVHLKGAGPYTLPKNGDYPLANGNGGKATQDVAKNTGPGVAFTLEARDSGADGNSIVATISDVDAGSQKFTLTAIWKTAKIDTLANMSTNFGYLIKADVPIGGFAPPAPGVVTLAGGADAQAATNAKAVVATG